MVVKSTSMYFCFYHRLGLFTALTREATLYSGQQSMEICMAGNETEGAVIRGTSY